MDDSKKSDLGEMIRDEMVIDYSKVLNKIFDVAKKYIRVTNNGTVDVLVKHKVPLKMQIILYLIGKLYAHEVNFSDTDSVGNQELMNELGIIKGSLLPRLKELRDQKKIKRVKVGRYVHHTIQVNLIERALKEVETKID